LRPAFGAQNLPGKSQIRRLRPAMKCGWAQAGSDIESPLRFTYNPNTSNYAWFTSSGCTMNDALGLDKVAPPPKAIAA